MSEFLSALKGIVLCQFEAPKHLLVRVNFGPINVRRVTVYGSHKIYVLPHKTPTILPRRKAITYETKQDREQGTKSEIVINLEDLTIDPMHAQGLYEPHRGSASIGVILFGIPSLLFTSPYWAISNWLAERDEIKFNMNSRALGFWKSINQHLDAETRDQLRVALEKW
jgi:hypothetical protein